MNVFVVETSSIPPGPRGYWVLGNLPDFAGDLLGFLTRCARDYGDIVRLRLGTSPAVLLNRPNQIEQVLVTRQAEFVKYRFFWRHVTRVFGNGLLTSAGSLWQRQHALMAPAFRQERLALSVDKMVCCANRLFDRWQDGERDIRADMTRLTLEIAAKVLFDVELDRAVAGISRAELLIALGDLNELPLLSLGRDIGRAQRPEESPQGPRADAELALQVGD
jgi:cytochrome P450